MATQGRRTSAAVAERLRKQPGRFDFFQAVRLLEHVARKEMPARKLQSIGTDAPPTQEVVRFRSSASRTFPPNEIDQLKARDTDLDISPFEMTVSFMGLYGPAGVLPNHYTQLVIDQARRKENSLRDFLDVFNHRVISHFFRAWMKYRLPLAYERRMLWDDPEADSFTEALHALVGIGTPRLQERLEVSDETLLYFSGHFCHSPRNAVSLGSLLSEYSGHSVEVQQFRGEWLYLETHHRSMMPTTEQPLGQNCQLGTNFIVGDRVWSVESAFRIRIGPVDYRSFQSLMPGKIDLIKLAQLTRTYVGMALDFDFQIIVHADQVPPIQLDQSSAARLGMNTWLLSKPMKEDAEEAIFVHDGRPTR